MRIDAGIIHDLLEEIFLRGSMRVRDGDGIRRMVGDRLEDDPQDTIIVGLCVLKALKDDRANPVTSTISVGVVVVSLAIARFGQELSTTQSGEDVRVGHDVQTPSDGSVALASP